MYEIISKRKLCKHVNKVKLQAPLIAAKANPGQFIMLRIDETGERIPLTLNDWDVNKGTIDIVFQEIGKTTEQLGSMNEGEKLFDVVGPLGKPSKIEKYGNVVCVGGGIGIATIYPMLRALIQKGNHVSGIFGARDKGLIVLEDEIREYVNNVYFCTDNGSYGEKGLVTDLLNMVLAKQKIDCIFAIGPVPMMKAVSEIGIANNIETRVSLDTIMLDGVGMCGTCRVNIFDKVFFACVDGPEFNAKGIDFAELIMRRKRFFNEEKQCLQKYHDCRGNEKCHHRN